MDLGQNVVVADRLVGPLQSSPNAVSGRYKFESTCY
jgi:hypothetical protein